ncbi:selenocysteine-specific translation elongation factor [Halomonas korlensis]|uniref:Selenocysteine-specific elongation factor n=1 Tax=Halomonas korlensis TaxID=463301 RepID=A0A1I7GXX9_9GAMM|nr:selenocysteine-specific translation elongation factor [Halomonas korlensis]SFU53116.1 selenocysteine-specific elongation factor [Halomonas korlensis]
MIVGTAGHVDHGKTALIQQLTGIDTDRLKEEKARGLTIEAGFAYPEADTELDLGFVDVPGHERFIHNMLAGSAGIDTVLLVVAADDGVMPQTIEHVQILQLLGLTNGIVALTKIDLVDEARSAEVQREIAALLADTPLAGAPIYPLSSRSGEGVAALRDALWSMAAAPRQAPVQGQFRLAIDRAFSKPGAGLVVTGTALSGRVRQGDPVRLVASGRTARVRRLRRQHRPSDQARQGDRVALNLAGAGIERDDVQRGDWVVADALETPALKRLDIHLQLLDGTAVMAHWTPVHVHLGVTRVMGRVALLEGPRLAPGGRMLSQLVLDRPVHACLGDRFVIRDQGGHATLGGGVVLDGNPPRRGQRAPTRLAWLAALAEAVADASRKGPPIELRRPLQVALDARPDGLDLAAIAWHTNTPLDALVAIVESLEGRVVVAQHEVRAFSHQAIEALETRMLDIVAANHQREPAMPGTERARLNRQAMPGIPGAVFRPLLKALIDAGRLERQGPFVALPGHRAGLDAADETLWQRLAPLLAATPFQPPRVRDMARDEGLDEQRLRAALTACARLGRLYQVRKDHFYLDTAVRDMAAIIQRLEAQHGTVRCADFRDRIATGRKLAIHILEFFDSLGYTRRVRDERVIRQADLWH